MNEKEFSREVEKEFLKRALESLAEAGLAIMAYGRLQGNGEEAQELQDELVSVTAKIIVRMADINE